MNVIVTGASRGIGKAVAEIFAMNGHSLFLTSRSDVAIYKAVEDLVTRYPDSSIKGIPFDLSDKQQSKQFAEWALQETAKAGGSPDVLVNNAGVFEPGGVHNEPDDVLENQIATNLYSAYHLTRALLPAMMKDSKGHPGRHIFNLCSIASLRAYPNGGAYSISKFALYGFSQNLREEMKPHGIKVTAVLPGAVMTDSWEGYDNSKKRIMEATDIARMIYAASQLSPQACVEEILIRPQLGDL